MTGSRPDEEAIFSVARKIDASAVRAEYLRQTCGDDQVLFDRVATLLRLRDEESGFLESPIAGLGSVPEVATLSEKPGAVIGPYKLLEQIGSGGMGLVFMAEQQQPMRRMVALKIIKPGMDTRQVIARFEAERQALALMDHPNIARVLDAGATDSGHPYFVMELVRGIPVTEYCDQARLPTRERLQLFITVCEAVQHAHQKGIIHRDIKPSNILVTMHDDKAVPKVIDFGVAKATNQRLVERTLFTNFAQMIGTPTYMSPEQTQMSGLDVDTRSDVYSLGVLLYELLTGSTPFDTKRLHEAGYDELRRIIRDEEPPRPSARITSFATASQSTIAGNRNIDQRKFSQALRGDLDWIVMKALEKDRQRRYESVSTLIADVKRHLADEPVEACPPSPGYRLRKFARRRKRLFAFLSLFAGFLVVSIVGLATAYVLISREQTEVLRQRRFSHENAEMVLQREDTIRRYLYAADIQLAWTAYSAGGANDARQRLLRQRPVSEMSDGRGFEWHYLWNLCQDQSQSYQTHQRHVYYAVFSPDGKWLASTSADRSVVVWNVADRTPFRVLRDFHDDVNSANFSADGKFLATAEENRIARVWELETGREIARFSGFDRPVVAVFFTADQRTLVATEVDFPTNEGRLLTWDLATQTSLKVIDGYRGLAVDSRSQLLAACNSVGELSLWSLPELERQSAWQGHATHVLCGAFSPDGRHLATGCRNGNVKLWKLDGHVERQLSRNPSTVTRGVTFSPDGKLLITVNDDGAVVRFWDVASGTMQKVIEAGTHGQLWSADVSPDGEILAIGCADGAVELRQLSKMTFEKVRIHESKARYAVALDSATQRLAVVDDGQTTDVVTVLDAESGKRLRQLADPDGCRISTVAFAGDGHSIWIGTGQGMVRKLDLATGECHSSLKLYDHYERWVTSLFVSPTGRFLATDSSTVNDPTSRIKVCDLQSGRVVFPLNGQVSELSKRSPDLRGFLSESVVLARRDRTAFKWDLETDRELSPQFVHEGLIAADAVSHDGKTLAIGIRGGAVHLWDVDSGDHRATVPGRRHDPSAIAFSPDGRTLAVANESGEISLWHLSTAQPLFDLHGHTGAIRLLVFSRDGRLLVSAGKTAEGKDEVFVWGASAAKPDERMTLDGRGGPN
jgi:WD40 repeat protein/serine/threonine protein kinase